MFRAVGVTVSLAAAAVALTSVGGADASGHRGGTTRISGPVLVSGLCSGRAAYHGSVRQDGDTVVMTIHVRRGGERVRWSLSTEATTHFRDGSAVTGIGDFGSLRSNADGRFEVSAGTPLGVRHEIKVHLSRPTGDRCFVRVEL